ncbi:hypothetical protein ACRQ5D_18360 [Mucilaginibacter sp. P25]|uniref:hypothetical protein n=1 Tax=unclassified Mucilaginibacter TaxID=2617802 RepID=UPI003D66E110
MNIELGVVLKRVLAKTDFTFIVLDDGEILVRYDDAKKIPILVKRFFSELLQAGSPMKKALRCPAFPLKLKEQTGVV